MTPNLKDKAANGNLRLEGRDRQANRGKEFRSSHTQVHSSSSQSVFAQQHSSHDGGDLAVFLDSRDEVESGHSQPAKSSAEPVNPSKSFVETKARWELLRSLVASRNSPEESPQAVSTTRDQELSSPVVHQEVRSLNTHRSRIQLSPSEKQSKQNGQSSRGLRPLMLVESLATSSVNRSSYSSSEESSLPSAPIRPARNLKQQSCVTPADLQSSQQDQLRPDPWQPLPNSNTSSTSHSCPYCHTSMILNEKTQDLASASTSDIRTPLREPNAFNLATSSGQGKPAQINPRSPQVAVRQGPFKASVGSRIDMNPFVQPEDQSSRQQLSFPSQKSDSRIEPFLTGHRIDQGLSHRTGLIPQPISAPQRPHQAAMPQRPDQSTTLPPRASAQQNAGPQGPHQSWPAILPSQAPPLQPPSNKEIQQPPTSSNTPKPASRSHGPTMSAMPSQSPQRSQPALQIPPSLQPFQPPPNQIRNTAQHSYPAPPGHGFATLHPISKASPVTLNTPSEVNRNPSALPPQQRSQNPVQFSGNDHPDIRMPASSIPSRPSGFTREPPRMTEPNDSMSAKPSIKLQETSSLGSPSMMVTQDQPSNRDGIRDAQREKPAYGVHKPTSEAAGTLKTLGSLSLSLQRVGAQRRPSRIEAGNAIRAEQKEGNLHTATKNEKFVPYLLLENVTS